LSRTETRGLARTILALVVAMLVGFVLFTNVPPSGGIVNAQTSPTNNCGAIIQWLNPSANGLQSEISDENPEDPTGPDRFHLVAWVSTVPTGAVVDFKYKPTGNEVNIKTNVAKSGNVFEFFWDIPPELDDSNVTLQAILSTNNTECTRDEQSVFVNNDSASPVGDPTAPTVEMTDPINNQSMGFYKNPAGTSIGVIKVNASDGATYVRGVYSVSTPGTEPAWKSCGTPETAAQAADGIRCTLATGDDPNEVTAVGAVANRTPNPLPYEASFDGSSDAHRVASYYQDPTTLTLEFVDGSGNSTGPSAPNTGANGCSPNLRATVNDQAGRPIPGMNVDFHAKGPSDDLGFAPGVPADAFKNPDMGAHATPAEAARVCPLGTQGGMQGEHDKPGSEADEKHVESTNGTNNAGQFHIRLFSPATGVTQITAFADVDGDDDFCSSEQNDDAAIGWGTTQNANVVGLDPQETTCTRPNVSPSPSSAPPTATPTSTQTSSPSSTSTTSTTATTSSPSGDRRVATKLTIKYQKPVFSGKANSSVASCRRGRRLVVKKVKPGTDARVATKKTNKNGGWKLRKGSAKGRYYAVVAKKVFTDAGGTTVICQRDKSNVVRARRK
jgi:hypothetical protein